MMRHNAQHERGATIPAVAVTKRNAAKVERIAVQERCEVALLQALQAKRWTCRRNRFSAYTQQDLQVDLHKPTSQTRMSADAC
jgi:hypothetical protein